VADEAVSALDVSVRAQILNLLKELQDDFQLTYLFISHDLSVIRHICDRIAVMYVGKLVESATSDELFRKPKHPYTEALLSAVPINDPDDRGKRDRIRLAGEVADPANPPSGCYFHPRCSHAQDQCATEEPIFKRMKGTESMRTVKCHYAEELDLQGAIID
jgi:peptide/nickel transport system ATP-binding protein